MITYQQLIHAQALLLHQNLRKASKSENFSQPAFSRSIANLEHSLEVQLFNRRRSGVTPAIYGEIFQRYSSEILTATTELEREIYNTKGLGIGDFKVAFAPFPAELSGNCALGKLISNYPNIRCRVGLQGHTLSQW